LYFSDRFTSRYGLVFPWGQDPPLSAPGKELYIAPLLPEHPVPEYLQLLDNVKIPVKRDGPIFCGIFVLSKGRVTILNPTDRPHPMLRAPVASISPRAPPIPAVPAVPAASVVPVAPSIPLPGIPPVVAPALASSLSNLSESSLATLSKDLANLTPSQLELVRSLLLQQPAPAPVLPAQPLPLVPPPSVGLAPPHVPTHMLPSHPPAGTSGALSPGNLPPSHPPVRDTPPANWDRPRGWEPGPGPARYGRDDFRDERPPYGRGDPRDDRPPHRGRGAGPSRYRGKGNRGGPRW
jgi:hypothetical protein